MNLIDFSQIRYGNFLANAMRVERDEISLDEQQNQCILSQTEQAGENSTGLNILKLNRPNHL